MVCVLLTIFLLIPGCCWGLGLNYEKAWENELRLLIAKHPQYGWGRADDEKADCSGYLYLTARRAGFPAHRTTSLEMSRGRGGWIGRDILFRDSRAMDVVFWTFSKARPCGHLGVAIRHPKYGVPAVTHSSSTRGVVCDWFQGSLLRDLSKTRRLTIGDP